MDAPVTIRDAWILGKVSPAVVAESGCDPIHTFRGVSLINYNGTSEQRRLGLGSRCPLPGLEKADSSGYMWLGPTMMQLIPEAG